MLWVAAEPLPAKFDPPDFALALARKDVALACEVGREFDVPMKLAHTTLVELTEAINQGWGHLDSRIAMVLQSRRAGVEIRVSEERLQQILDDDG